MASSHIVATLYQSMSLLGNNIPVEKFFDPTPSSCARVLGRFAGTTPGCPATTTLANFVALKPYMVLNHILRAHKRCGMVRGRSRQRCNHMDLGLEIRTTGRRSVPLVIDVIGDVEMEDLQVLDLPRESVAPTLKRLSDRHHALARALASGLSERDAAITCGYSSSAVSILKTDPAFKELLEFYRDRAGEAFETTSAKLAALTNEALSLLIEKMENDPESLTVSQLHDLAKLGADRSGYGPQSSQTNLNLNVGVAERLNEARKRVALRRGE